MVRRGQGGGESTGQGPRPGRSCPRRDEMLHVLGWLHVCGQPSGLFFFFDRFGHRCQRGDQPSWLTRLNAVHDCPPCKRSIKLWNGSSHPSQGVIRLSQASYEYPAGSSSGKLCSPDGPPSHPPREFARGRSPVKRFLDNSLQFYQAEA